ncbi:MAG: M1 family aminopeptidase [Candidatus Binatia bacterium]
MNDRDFRLSKDVIPTRYDLAIEVDVDRWRYRASERIGVTIHRPQVEIVLHATGFTIDSARVVAGTGAHTAAVSWNAEAETVRLRCAEPIPTGPAVLEFEFRGEIRDRLRGFYRSTKDGERYAATQFEAADARRAFPCFDEPEFKARFALTLTIPSGTVAIANAPEQERRTLPDGRTEIRFVETPPISSYLVAYLIGPFEATPAIATPSGVPVRVWLPRGLADKGLFARDAHARSLAYLEDYTGIAYPYTKADAIGIPDFEAGAMENPGAITYRLTAIAADAARASTPALKGIFYTAAHEMTHMWWGDLVTMAWWNDLWLNESFATFVGYQVTADLMPEWGMWRDFVATLTRPFALDALESTHPISFEVKNAKQASERFDVITYWKGAGVVRMIADFLGAEAFRAGVRQYLQRYRERNATADDFWRELSTASGRDVATIANAWIREPGHPVVHVTATPAADGLRLQLRQERFFADPNAAARYRDQPQTWPLPLVIKYGTDAGAGERRELLDRPQAALTLPGARWVYPNGGASGFYRFTMDDTSLRALLAHVQSALGPHERLALLDNQWTLLKAGIVSVEQYLTGLDAYRSEPDRAVVATIGDQLGSLSTHMVVDSARTHFERFVDTYYRAQFDALGWTPRTDESADERLKRASVIAALGGIARTPAVRTEARSRLDEYLVDRAALDPNLVSVVVGIAARDGDGTLYDRYLERKRSATTDPEEEQRFLLGLAAFERPELIQRTLDLALGTEVRAQDRTFLLAGLLGRRASRLAAWAFVRERWDRLVTLMDPMLLQNLIRALGQLTPEPAATEVRAFLSPRARDETRETVAQVSEQLALDAAACARIQPALAAALRTRAEG